MLALVARREPLAGWPGNREVPRSEHSHHATRRAPHEGSDPAATESLPTSLAVWDGFLPGGAEGIRTPDLLSAIQARSQLRHSPKRPPVYGAAGGVSNEATTVVIGADDEWRTSGIGVTA